MRIQTWRDEMRDGLVVRLEDGIHYVQTFLTDEEMYRASSLVDLKERTIKYLCYEWEKSFGKKWVPILPRPEGTEWTFTQHETIDGEVVVKEIESA